MGNDERLVNDQRPREMDFDEVEFSSEEEKSKEYPKQNPFVIVIICLVGLVAAAAGILIYNAFRTNHKSVVDVVVKESSTEVAETTKAEITEATTGKEIVTISEVLNTEVTAAANAGSTESSSETDGTSYEIEYGGNKYQIINGTAIFQKCSSPDPIMELPQTVNTIPVVEIGEKAFEGCQNLTHLWIPSGVVKIQSGAFVNCPNFSEVIIPDSVNFIAENAFEGDLKLVIKSHAGAYAQSFAGARGIPWIEGDSLTVIQ